MIKIAEVLPPKPSPLWRMVKQCGVDYVVGGMDWTGGIDNPDPDLRPWGFMSLARVKSNYENAGFTLDTIENRPNLTKASLTSSDNILFMFIKLYLLFKAIN